MLRRVAANLRTTLRPLAASPSHPFPSQSFISPRLAYFSSTTSTMSAPHPVSSTSTPADPAGAVPAQGAPAAPSAGGEQPKKAPKEKKGKKADIVAGMNALELNPAPEYLASRVELFEQLKKEADEKLAGASFPFFPPAGVVLLFRGYTTSQDNMEGNG
jgi:hypothetical protein